MKNNNFLNKFKKVIWILTPFILLATIIILLMKHYKPEEECFDCNELQEKIDNIEQKIKDKDCLDCNWENIDDIENDTIIDGKVVSKPTENCRVHFSGLLMGGKGVANHISQIYKVDNKSEYVGEGEYTDNRRAFPKSVSTTFDGIAIDSGTRLIIYSGPNFTERVLLDVTGPTIINNSLWRDDSRYAHCNTDRYPPELEATYPPSVRQWSSENMHSWSFGSCKIICNE